MIMMLYREEREKLKMSSRFADLGKWDKCKPHNSVLGRKGLKGKIKH